MGFVLIQFNIKWHAKNFHDFFHVSAKFSSLNTINKSNAKSPRGKSRAKSRAVLPEESGNNKLFVFLHKNSKTSK